MSSGRVGGETTRRSTTTCSSSPITRASRSRCRGGTTYRFVTDGIERALARAKESADGQDVMLWGGAQIINQYLAAGLLDELELHIVPVLLGGGARLFDNLGGAEIKLEQVRAVEAPGVTHVKYTVVRG
jgi:dihydrofolate reductase